MRGVFAIEYLPSSVIPLAKRSSALTDASTEFCARDLPLMMQLAPARDWITAASVGSVTQSCVQATRPRCAGHCAVGIDRRQNSVKARAQLRASVALREA
jgi:hypothetical protein